MKTNIALRILVMEGSIFSRELLDEVGAVAETYCFAYRIVREELSELSAITVNSP